MSDINETQVIIAGKVLTLTGYETAEYTQKVANYINKKLDECKATASFRSQNKETQMLLVALNIADDYMKIHERNAEVESLIKDKDKEIYNLKHDIVTTQSRLDKADEQVRTLQDKMAESSKKLIQLDAKLRSKEKEAKSESKNADEKKAEKSSSKRSASAAVSEDEKNASSVKAAEEKKNETAAKPAEDKKPEAAVKPAEDKKTEAAVKPAEDKKPEAAVKPAEDKKPEADALRSRYYDCDLLIIDDLGTEMTNSFVGTELFTMINERYNARRSVIISTNLELPLLRDRYSDRIFSRLTGSYDILKLSGPDLRNII